MWGEMIMISKEITEKEENKKELINLDELEQLLERKKSCKCFF